MNKYHNYKIITQKNIYTMNYFENKLKKQKDNIYKNYLKLLKKQKITLECEFINIEHSDDCLTDLINNFYEYEKLIILSHQKKIPILKNKMKLILKLVYQIILS